MRKFLSTYRSLFLIYPVLYITGNIFEPLSYVVLLAMMVYWISKGEDRILILAMIFILILGDNRSPNLLFFKNLRILAILVLTLRSFFDIATKKYHFNPHILISLPFFVIALIGSFSSPTPGTAIAKMISYFFLLFLALNYFPYHFLRYKGQLLMDIVYVSIVVFALGLLLLVLHPGFVYLVVRYRGLLGNPNGLGLYAIVMTPLIVLAYQLFPQKRTTNRLAIGLLIFSVLMCESRTALGTIGIFFFLYYFYTHGKLLRVSLWLFVVPVLAFFFLVVDLPELLESLGLGEYLRADSITTGTGRFLAWGLGWNKILENPWIGNGFAYEEYFFQEMHEFLLTTEHQGGMHNSYLTFLMNNGFIGFFLFLIFLISLFRKIKVPGMGVPFAIAMLLCANFESWLNSSLNAFTIHFLLALTVMSLYPQLKKITAAT